MLNFQLGSGGGGGLSCRRRSRSLSVVLVSFLRFLLWLSMSFMHRSLAKTRDKPALRAAINHSILLKFQIRNSHRFSGDD